MTPPHNPAHPASEGCAFSWAQRLGPDFNVKALERLAALDPDGRAGLLARLVTVFEQTLNAQAQGLQAAAAVSDFQAIRRAAHSARSASASLGAEQFAQACLEVERAAATQLQVSDPAAAVSLPGQALRLAEQAHGLLLRMRQAQTAAPTA